jgi:RNA polymerase sigma-70 factor, ECF subfamily
MDDLEITAKLKRGDNDVFPIVVGKYQKLVLNCSYKFLRNRESAEDLTQEVFLEVWESIHTFRGDSLLSTWIYRITVTKALNHIKRLKRKKRFGVIVDLFQGGESEEQLSLPEQMGPDKELETKERARILNWALDKLPDNQRIAFTLSKYDELSYREISLIMNTSIPSIESLLHRAKANLKKKLHRYYSEHL